MPAILPPPSPFKVFVLMAGVAGLPVMQFVTAIALARGLRYFGEGWLAVRYGDQAIALLEENGRTVSLVIVAVVVAAVVAYLFLSRRRPADTGTAR